MPVSKVVLTSLCVVVLFLNGILSAPAYKPKTCESVLRELKKHPPPHTNIYLREPIRTTLQVKYRCVKGATMKDGKKQVIKRCVNGSIIGKKPLCKLISCGKPKSIPNAHYSGTTFTYGSRIHYKCRQGYEFSGRSHRKCKKNGKWTKKPKCVSVSCPMNDAFRLHHGQFNTSDSTYGEGATIVFKCNEGYELSKDDTSTCVRRQWSSFPFPYCKARACPDPGFPENGRRVGRNFRIGGTVRFGCHSGLKLIGSRIRTCLENKLWSGSLPVCDDISITSGCPRLGAPVSGRMVKKGYRHDVGTVAHFFCKEGYVLVGSPVRKCLSTRVWNGTEAKCMDEFEYMVKNSNNTAFILKKNIDKMLEYTCSGMNTTCNLTAVDLRARAINPNHVGGLDIVFVFDASSSIKKSDFKLGLRFAQELVKLLGSTWKPGGTQVAALSYGTNAKIEFNLGDASVNTAPKVIKKIGKITRLGGGTASRIALDLARKSIVPFTRKGSQKVLFFITDGHSNIGGSPRKVARVLRDVDEFEVYSVGVGKKVKRRELMEIASEPEDEHVISVRKYKELVNAVKQAVDIKIDYTPCGVSTTNLRARMVGGNKAGRGAWPWQIGIHKLDESGNLVLVCGGALIDKRWVLTAAHCFHTINPVTGSRGPDIVPPQIYTIKLGDHHLMIQEPAQQELEAEDIFIYQNYKDSPKLSNDIALVKLPEGVKLGPFVRTVCLPKHGEKVLVPGKFGVVAGWGATQVLKLGQKPVGAKATSRILRQSAFTIQNDKLCDDRTNFFLNSTVTFCAGDGKGGNDTCHGDSGGSFVREVPRGGSHRWVTAGLVSWGEGCAQKNKYGYYTRVTPFVDWIEKTMKDNK